jgi:hypothetical protein
MSGNVLTLVTLKRAGPLLTGLVFAILVAGSGNAADLRLRINVTPLSQSEFERFLADRHEMPASAEARKQLFQEFLLWRRAREHH